VLLLVTGLLLSSFWTGLALAQQNEMRRVGILTFSAIENAPRRQLFLAKFRRKLATMGWFEGKNVSFEYRSAQDDPTQFANAAKSLVRSEVDVIWAVSAPALRAAYNATRTIPIVGADLTTDPIAAGYIEHYARPGGNVTGIFLDAPAFAGKWLELLQSMIPNLSRVAVLWDPGPGPMHLQAVREVGKSHGIRLQIIEVPTPDDIDKAFSALSGEPQAVILLPSPLIFEQSAQLADLLLERRLPATSMVRQFATSGGTIAYGPGIISTIERHAVLVAKILSGSSPAELPVERPTVIRLVINLKTAKTIGIKVPQSILLRADEVIE